MEYKRDRDNSFQLSLSLAYSSQSSELEPFCLAADLDLPGSGINAIFGPSGCGKTSLLRCIAGLERAEGEIWIKGECWQDKSTFLATHKRNLAYVFQEASLLPHLNVSENLGYAIKRSDIKARDIEQRLESVLDIMGVEHLLQRLPTQLSGGERQRVAIARALLIKPDVLIMDEPLAALDAQRKQEVMPYLEGLGAKTDACILYVSHSMDEVAKLADHLTLMDAGKVKVSGSLQSVLASVDSPLQSLEDAGVVLEVRVQSRDEQWGLLTVSFEGGTLFLVDKGEAIGQRLRLRVLARDVSLTIHNQEQSSIANRLQVRIEAIAPSPSKSMAIVQLSVGQSKILSRVTHRSIAMLDLKVGSMIWAQIKSVAIAR